MPAYVDGRPGPGLRRAGNQAGNPGAGRSHLYAVADGPDLAHPYAGPHLYALAGRHANADRRAYGHAGTYRYRRSNPNSRRATYPDAGLFSA